MVEQGEEVVIARNGVQTMKLVPIVRTFTEPRDLSKLVGLASGIETIEEWEALDEELLALIKFDDDDL